MLDRKGGNAGDIYDYSTHIYVCIYSHIYNLHIRRYIDIYIYIVYNFCKYKYLQCLRLH